MRIRINNLIYYGIVFIIILTTFSAIRKSDDIYRHLLFYKKIDLNLELKNFIKYYYKNTTNFIFYSGLYFIKKYSLSFNLYRIFIILIYYFSIFINLKKINKYVLIIIFVYINPFYVSNGLHFPLAISAFNIAFYFRKNMILKYIFILISYYIHTGILYIIFTYLLSEFKIIRTNIRKIYLITIIFIFTNKVIIEIFYKFTNNYLNNPYLSGKIKAYFIDGIGRFEGGMGVGTRIIVIYIFITFITYMFVHNINYNDKDQIFFYLLILITLFLSTSNLVFSIRSLFFLIMLYSKLLTEKRIYKIDKIMILLGSFGIVDYRFFFYN